MKISPCQLPEVLLIELDAIPDHRGFFLETFHAQKMAGALPEYFVQHNTTRSKKGVLRGLHGQLARPQGKLVRVSQGQIFDVAVDVREGSPRFGQWLGIPLSGDKFQELYIPPGFLHGFFVVSDVADVEYHCTDFYDPADEFGVRWDDPEIKIAWPGQNPVLSAKDAAHPFLAEWKGRLPVFK